MIDEYEKRAKFQIERSTETQPREGGQREAPDPIERLLTCREWTESVESVPPPWSNATIPPERGRPARESAMR